MLAGDDLPVRVPRAIATRRRCASLLARPRPSRRGKSAVTNKGAGIDGDVSLEFVGEPHWAQEAVDVLVRILRKARERGDVRASA